MIDSETDASSLEEPKDDAGLCRSCAHVRVQENRRGSAFYRCGLAEKDARFRRYPQLPVRTCDGYRRASE